MNINDCSFCTPGAPCRAHRVVQDGGVVRVPLTMMDSVQRAVAGEQRGFDDSAGPKGYQAVLAANRAAAPRALADASRNAERVQAFADHFRGR